ncbi:hypothetical protein [Winogradskyella aurantiaca]|uniref:hypothetical protein n=1 Tax=Winogradskyella aurantiaca TaxID=2219558 RepID=UPI000E1D4E73|nr:hypothetical protein [Winogradskyella aurantiaca]
MHRTTFLSPRLPKTIVLVLLFLCSTLWAQTTSAQKTNVIVDAFIDYTDTAREVIYLHLNKSTYIKGESIGFTAYVMDKKEKMPSLLTTNLYVSIEDMNQNPIKQQLLRVNNGVTSNVIDIDDNFATGSYIVKAYTNWSRNFKEPNYFSTTVKIIDPATDAYVDTERVETAIDAQFLPESGHLLANVVNKVGVVIKDTKGYGVANATGKVFDKVGTLLTSFDVNHLGIGQFLLKPSVGDNFKIVITHNYKDFDFSFNQTIEPIGLVLNTTQHNNQLMLNVITNEQSLKYFKDQAFQLSFHNGSDLQVETLRFNDQTMINRTYNMKQLPPGITVFTLFNDRNKPIAERLAFNYNGINMHPLSKVQTAMVENDSIDVSLAFDTIDPTKFHNISVSVLPAETKSYKHHHNLISYNYLQPYIQGTVEQAKYYFTNTNAQTAADLDMLLLTQGWSSYNWNNIFNNNNSLPYDFEQGISLKANVNGNSNKPKTFMVHAIEDKVPVFVELNETQSSFQVDNTFVSDTDKVALSELGNNERLSPAKLYLQSFPNNIPKIALGLSPLEPKPDYNLKTSFDNNYMSTKTLDQVQELDEVVIMTDVTRTRNRYMELSARNIGQVRVPLDRDRDMYWTVGDWLSTFRARNIFSGDPVRDNRLGGRVYLDDVLTDASIVVNLPTNILDYAVFGYNGFNEIRFYTDLSIPARRRAKDSFTDFDLALTFTSEKKFYRPLYRLRSDDFYKHFGTISWEPHLLLNQYSKTHLKIERPLIPVTLFIEGMDHLGNPIFVEHELNLN